MLTCKWFLVFGILICVRMSNADLSMGKVRIAGGTEVEPHSMKYMVLLYIHWPTGGDSLCGGSLIDTKTVLTAAHCIDGAQFAIVKLGVHNITDNSWYETNASNFQLHEQWDKNGLKNDIALIHLNEEVTLSDSIDIITFASSDDGLYVSKNATVAGWGIIHDNENDPSDVLRYVTLTIIPNFVCNLAYIDGIQDSNVCGLGKVGVSSCSGDSGGPMVVDGVQVGIVSFGLNVGCEMGWPPVFTRVSSYSTWIKDNMYNKLSKLESEKNI